MQALPRKLMGTSELNTDKRANRCRHHALLQQVRGVIMGLSRKEELVGTQEAKLCLA